MVAEPSRNGTSKTLDAGTKSATGYGDAKKRKI